MFTFGVIAGSRNAPGELIKTTMNILSLASSYKYNSKDIVRKVDFVMTDRTAHNHNRVIEKVKKISNENYFLSTVTLITFPLFSYYSFSVRVNIFKYRRLFSSLFSLCSYIHLVGKEFPEFQPMLLVFKW